MDLELKKRFRTALILILMLFTAEVQAQLPVIKMDFNFNGRKELEVHEPEYTSWMLGTDNYDTLRVSGIKIELSGNPEYETSWYKAGVQSPYYARLVNDGLRSEDLEISFYGLPAGDHSLLFFHNTFDNPDNNVFSNIDIYVNGALKVSNLQQSNRAHSNEEASTSYLTFSVINDEKVTFRFKAHETAGATNRNVCVNGFELNTPNATRQAKQPLPENANKHVKIEDDQTLLQWSAADGALSHDIYIGTSERAVLNATHSSAEFRGNQTDTSYLASVPTFEPYYWRVDEVYANETVKGDVWSFQAGILAFPGAEGYGAYAAGGRGGKVVYVTNLNDSGPGSFRAAVTGETGPRTVIFNVSGIIYLKSRLVMDDYITVAGQTAPGKGICFRGAPIGVGNESICRFLRMRLGAGTTFDGIGMAGANFSIVDHCSVSWTIDEAFSSRNAKNITLQRTMLAEALNIAGHQNYPAGYGHGYAATISGEVGSFHHNLLAHCNGRNWSLGGGLDGNGYYAGKLDIFNNVIYNWGKRANEGGAHQVNFVNNYYRKGAGTTEQVMMDVQLENTGKGSQSYYYAGNVMQEADGTISCDGTENNPCGAEISLLNGQPEPGWDVFVDEPFFPSYARVEPAKDAFKSVLSDVGANMPMFDEHDQRIVQETLHGTYTYTGSLSGKGGIIDHQDDAGGYEDYPEISRPEDFDTDLDGLPDWWEEQKGSNKNSAEHDFSDANADPDRDGMTELENYLQWMSVPHFYIMESEKDTIDLAPLTVGYTKAPVFTSAKNNSNLSITYSGSKAIVTPTANSSGINYFDFRVMDSEGASMTRTIGVCTGIPNPEFIAVEPPVVDPPDQPTALEKDRYAEHKVYPSFFEDHLNIDMVLETDRSIVVEMINLNGQQCLSKRYNLKSGFNKITLDCPADLPQQLYVVKITDGRNGEIFTIGKVIKR